MGRFELYFFIAIAAALAAVFAVFYLTAIPYAPDGAGCPLNDAMLSC